MTDEPFPRESGVLRGWQRQLDENLRALPHLPPGATFAGVQAPLVRALLERVAASHEDLHGLAYLEQRCAEDVALLTAALLLDALPGLRLAGGADPSIGPRMREQFVALGMSGAAASAEAERLLGVHRATFEPLVGEALGAPIADAIGSIEWFASIDTASRAQLREALASCRAASGFAEEDDPAWSRGAAACADTLLADVLRLPRAVDPLRWLEEHRISECARIVGRSALSALVPQPLPAPTAVAAAVRKVRASASVSSLRVEVKGIAELPGSSRVELDFRVRYPPGLRSIEDVRSGPWVGFSRVTDERGYRRVVEDHGAHWFNRWRKGSWGGTLTLACWPPFGNAQELVMDDLPAALNLWQDCPAGHAHPIPGPVLGDIALTVTLH